MNKKLLVATLVSGLSFGVVAETPSFKFFEIGYTELDLDGSSVKPDGYEFDFNYELSKNYYLSADYAKVEEGGANLKSTSLGFGYKSEISNKSALFTEIDWVKIQSNDGYSENGYSLAFGIRSNFTENLELSAAYEYEDVDSETANYYTLGAAYKFTDEFAVYSDYKMESDINQLSLGVRFEF